MLLNSGVSLLKRYFLLNSCVSLQPGEQIASSEIKPRPVEVGLTGLGDRGSGVPEAGVVRREVWVFLSAEQICTERGDPGTVLHPWTTTQPHQPRDNDTNAIVTLLLK